MLRLCITPTTFDVFDFQESQNEYIKSNTLVNTKKVNKQHHSLEKAFDNIVSYKLSKPKDILPDIVFVANGGVCLPRISRTILLPSMKYAQRQAELPYLIEIYKDLGLRIIPPLKAVFEGQAEIKWFHGGTKAIGGYGFRSTKKTFDLLEKTLAKIYKDCGLEPPKILAVPLEHPDYYHLDLAMLEFDDSKCIVHKRAFSEASVKKIRTFLGKDAVHVIDVKDSFCLNAVVDGEHLITHSLETPVKNLLETITGKKIKEVDTSEFEKSGGSVRCMTLDLFPF